MQENVRRHMLQLEVLQVLRDMNAGQREILTAIRKLPLRASNSRAEYSVKEQAALAMVLCFTS